MLFGIVEQHSQTDHKPALAARQECNFGGQRRARGGRVFGGQPVGRRENREHRPEAGLEGTDAEIAQAEDVQAGRRGPAWTS
jgi:hypothetical protein